MAISNELRRRYQFFRTYGLGAAYSLKLGRAELEAERLNLDFEQETDSEGCCNPDDCPTKCEDCCWIRAVGFENETLASLGGICGANDKHIRLLRAELYAEALAELANRPSKFPRYQNGKLIRHGDGYPLTFFTEDGGTLCPACADGENGSEAHEHHADKQWRLIGCQVHWEGEPEICEHCGTLIESAYGVPEESA